MYAGRAGRAPRDAKLPTLSIEKPRTSAISRGNSSVRRGQTLSHLLLSAHTQRSRQSHPPPCRVKPPQSFRWGHAEHPSETAPASSRSRKRRSRIPTIQSGQPESDMSQLIVGCDYLANHRAAVEHAAEATRASFGDMNTGIIAAEKGHRAIAGEFGPDPRTHGRRLRRAEDSNGLGGLGGWSRGEEVGLNQPRIPAVAATQVAFSLSSQEIFTHDPHPSREEGKSAAVRTDAVVADAACAERRGDYSTLSRLSHQFAKAQRPLPRLHPMRGLMRARVQDRRTLSSHLE